MSEQVDIIPPGSQSGDSEPIDNDCAQQASKLLYDDMSTRDKVWTLRYQYGWNGQKIGRALGISRQAVHRHCVLIEQEMEQDSGPQASRRRAIIRERLEAQYARAMEVTDPERSVVLALKTLEVMAKLDGLNLEAQDGGQKIQPYSPPEHIAAEVRALMLARWQRPALENTEVAPTEGEKRS